ncbi:MAG: flavodoxin family protein [Zhaonellaceae bacterium]|jgi:multimeric flavodoxin WrbA|nr:flavodoxin family protein [Clostridia bacterium]
MYIIGLNGSPQKDGNTAFLLENALQAAKDKGAKIELIHAASCLVGLKNPFCIQCAPVCDHRCIKGTILEEVYNKMRKCDGLLIASPVYFGTVSGQLKAFWDKTRIMRKEKALYNVVGGALAVGASRFGGQETTLAALQEMMLVQGMTVVGDGYAEDDCGHGGAAAQKPSDQDEYGLKRAAVIGKRVAEVALATRHLRLGRE